MMQFGSRPLNEPVYNFRALLPVSTAQAGADALRRGLRSRDKHVVLRRVIEEEPRSAEFSSPVRWCGVALAVGVLCGGSVAVALAYSQPNGRWQRFIPRLGLPQVKSDEGEAFRDVQVGLHEVQTFKIVTDGTCVDYGYRPIMDFLTCRAGAAVLQLLEAGFPITWDEHSGCHYWQQSTHRICLVPGVADGGGAALEVALMATSTTATTTTASTEPPCGPMETGFEYPGNDLTSARAPDAESCCRRCAQEPRCLLWTWRSSPAEAEWGTCLLKGSQPRSAVTRVANAACVSGQRAGSEQAVQVKAAWPGRSLFCFSLMLPFGYEPGLLAFQYRHSAGIFECDEYAVYSNSSLKVGPGVTAGVVASTLVVRKGGEFGTALNTDVFLTVWAKVVRDGRFLLHDWTVKVDPDAVFFAPRLRRLLGKHKETEKGTYLNNCKFGMHGPVEVFSRNTVKALGAGAGRCMQHFIRLCSGKCQWGEDMFIDQCLMRVLGANREDEYRLLLEDHCDPPADWSSCQDRTAAAFHPFKTEEGYWRCWANATR